jgi:hypothetical protein
VEGADAVFVGTVEERDATEALQGSRQSAVLWRIRVEGVYHGSVHETQGLIGGLCSTGLAVGRRYLVFASKDPQPTGARAFAGATLYDRACGGTRASTGVDLPASLGPRSPPAAGEGGLADLHERQRPWVLAAGAAVAAALSGTAVVHLVRTRRRA